MKCVHALGRHVVGTGLFLGTVKLVVSTESRWARLNEIKPRWKALGKILIKGPDPKGMNRP